jgi:hypothetical protein
VPSTQRGCRRLSGRGLELGDAPDDSTVTSCPPIRPLLQFGIRLCYGMLLNNTYPALCFTRGFRSQPLSTMINLSQLPRLKLASEHAHPIATTLSGTLSWSPRLSQLGMDSDGASRNPRSVSTRGSLCRLQKAEQARSPVLITSLAYSAFPHLLPLPPLLLPLHTLKRF